MQLEQRGYGAQGEQRGYGALGMHEMQVVQRGHGMLGVQGVQRAQIAQARRLRHRVGGRRSGRPRLLRFAGIVLLFAVVLLALCFALANARRIERLFTQIGLRQTETSSSSAVADGTAAGGLGAGGTAAGGLGAGGTAAGGLGAGGTTAGGLEPGGSASAGSAYEGLSDDWPQSHEQFEYAPIDVAHIEFAPMDVAQIEDARNLALVNRGHPFLGDPEGGLIVAAWPGVPVGDTSVTLHAAALEAVVGLFDAARADGVGSLFVSSGYRGYDAQKRIYDDAQDESTAQPPGHSEHHTGMAADILAVGVAQSDMAGSPEGLWLERNAWKHGLILRYAKDKRDVTLIAHEPWHYRYVGQPHAWFCSQNNLCLEEYVDFLKETGGYSVSLGGAAYHVLYEAPAGSIINVPQGREYSVSGDNAGGYAITIADAE